MYYTYLKYVVKHKYFVMKECFRSGLYIRGLLHDNSKFLPSEFFPYAKFFYGKKVRSKTGYYKPTDTGNKDFDKAWMFHANRNKHHWQYWCIPDADKNSCIKIEDKYLIEMVCDWVGAAKAQGKTRESVLEWWEENNNKMLLHPETREDIENLLISLKNDTKIRFHEYYDPFH